MKAAWAGTGWSKLDRGRPLLDEDRKGDEGGRVMSGHEALNVRGEGRDERKGWFLERKMDGRRVADDDEADWSSDYKGEG
ncbi:hypothetical protein QCA50_000317 [Cerrena zonata]|uniref:Uncharacterized protein n=1 Tax=Cerrena zonata TaxID=2478898 RepID=A0AAW0GSP0_9APHY